MVSASALDVVPRADAAQSRAAMRRALHLAHHSSARDPLHYMLRNFKLQHFQRLLEIFRRRCLDPDVLFTHRMLELNLKSMQRLPINPRTLLTQISLHSQKNPKMDL